jgi:hypothetical protein
MEGVARQELPQRPRAFKAIPVAAIGDNVRSDF